MSRAVLLLFIGLASANVCQDVVHKASCSAEMDPRSCVECVRNQPAHLFTGANCTSADIRTACKGEGHPNVFGCADVTAAGCGTCFDHSVAFVKVCVWCKTDSECHDVGSLEDPCSNDDCISDALKTTCTDHNRADCSSTH